MGHFRTSSDSAKVGKCLVLFSVCLQLCSSQLSYSLCYLPQSGAGSGRGFVDLAGSSSFESSSRPMSFSSLSNGNPPVQTLSVSACDANIPMGSVASNAVPAALLRCTSRVSGSQLERILSGQSQKVLDFGSPHALESSLARMKVGMTLDVVLAGSCLQRQSLPLLYPNMNYLAIVAFNLKSSSAAQSVGEYEKSPIVFIPTHHAKGSQAVKALYNLVPCDSAAANTLAGEPCKLVSASRIKDSIQAVGMQTSTFAFTKVLSESN